MNAKQTIRSIRTERGISQETLAELLEVSRQTISKWENGQGRPSADSVAKLSEVFGIPAEAFLRDDWVPPEEKPPEIQVVEVPVEVKVEVPVEVPRPRNYRLLALLAAVVLAAGVLIGTLLFRERPEESVSQSTLESEVIDVPSMGGIDLLPLE
mgnify:CR=1 FL=1